MANYVRSTDRVFLQMCISLYTGSPAQTVGEYALDSATPRIAVYKTPAGDTALVFRGTQDIKDIIDDLSVAGISSKETSLYNQGHALLTSLQIPNTKLILTGHSLGGYVAMRLCSLFNTQAVVFNAAAPPTKPVTSGPGNRCTAYHIVGDLISSHISDTAAKVFRIDLGLSFADTVYAHGINRFLDSVGKKLITADEENLLYANFQGSMKNISYGLNGVATVLGTFSVAGSALKLVSRLVSSTFNNIPGTTPTPSGVLTTLKGNKITIKTSGNKVRKSGTNVSGNKIEILLNKGSRRVNTKMLEQKLFERQIQ